MGTLFSSVSARSARTLTESNLMSLTFACHEALLHFPDEVQHIWRKPNWSPTKWVYLFVRYVPLLFQVAILLGGVRVASPNCRLWYILEACFMQVTISAVDVILMLRVYALYSDWRWIRHFLAALFLWEQSMMLWVLAVSIPKTTFRRGPDSCAVDHPPHEWGFFALWAILTEGLLLGMTMRKFVRSVREGWAHMSLVRLLVLDGLWAFIVIFFTFLMNAIMYIIISDHYASIWLNWLYSISSVTACRLVLHMHTAQGPPPSVAQPPGPAPETGNEASRPRGGDGVLSFPSAGHERTQATSQRATAGHSGTRTPKSDLASAGHAHVLSFDSVAATTSQRATAGHSGKSDLDGDGAVHALSFDSGAAHSGHGRWLALLRSPPAVLSSPGATLGHGGATAASDAASAGHARGWSSDLDWAYQGSRSITRRPRNTDAEEIELSPV